MEVSILPLQRTLDVRSGDNLLDALRNHQIPVSYSCMAGRCGTCRCRIVSGNVLVTGAADTNRPATDGDSVLACQATVVEDCVIEIPEVDEIVVHPSKIIKTTVSAIEDLTHDIKRVRLALSKPFSFSPGQYASLQFAPELVRPYSMAVAAGGHEAEFHIRVVPGGRVTSYVATQLKVGDTVRLSGPLGTAYLRKKSADPIICIAGGTGLAPILSILRGMADHGLSNPVHLYFGVRSPRDIYGQAWLEELKVKLPNLTAHVVVTSSGEPGPYRTGVVTDAVKHDWESLAGWRAYVAGAPPMVDASTILLRQKGIRAEHVYADAFYASGV
jgi:ferredoxin-NAD(P)+ reductase (naphthalene dioxygenase ferredoxin-specific)